LIESVRAIKSADEIEVIHNAASITNAAMRSVVENSKSGVAENQIAAQIYKTIVQRGGVYAGLPVFISSGHRTLVTHATWSNKLLETGDNMLVELCGCVDRYAAPLFRTFSVGYPSPRLQESASIAVEMLDNTITAIKPGVTSHEVDAAAKRVAARAGFQSGVKKRAGYSVGVNFPPDWGEGHFLALKEEDQTVLQPGMVFHIPQTVRVDGYPPAGFSETVLVTPSGHEILTSFPRELIVV
jgi:Xaa-Pro dipeptidase